MKILAVNLPALPEVNLKPIKMEKLGAIVAIAGRNGAGKSRLLSAVEQWMQQYRDRASAAKRLQGLQSTVKNNQGHSNIPEWLREIKQLEIQLSCPPFTLTEDRPARIVRFVPNVLDLTDPSQLTPADTQTAASQINEPGVRKLPRGSFARIQLCQDRRWEATHPDRTIQPVEVEQVLEEYTRLKDLVAKFLNTELGRSANGEATLFGLPLGSTGLSDGQKVILQLCMAIHAQATGLNDVIIFMDEPENHLHPAALLDLIDAVKEKLANGQIWIATHSVPLLANLNSADIWWMEDGGISKAGARPDIVLNGLLGDESRRDRLASFLDLPFVLASNKFASECLIPPLTVSAATRDPQMSQIAQVLVRLQERSPRIRLLDFGAGKGRLPSELSETWSPEDRAKIDYMAFDSSTEDAEECRAAIDQLHGSSENRLFHDLATLRAHYDEGSFHVVVMCNVLHEILPTDWADLFGADGKITRLLRPDGFLLLVEVQQLPYGERAHHQGFLVLDTAQLRKLFQVTEADGVGFTHDSARDGWLKAHLISKALVGKFTHDSRRVALEDLRETSRDRIKELRAGESDYRKGRLHGFWVQQFANASLALV